MDFEVIISIILNVEELFSNSVLIMVLVNHLTFSV